MNAYVRVPLGEVCTIVGGGTPRRSNPAYFGGPVPWATPTDVTALDSLFIERTKETITEVALRESSARLVPAGTVLMTSRATIGYTAIATLPMATNQGFANLICSKRIVSEYLAYWLRDQREHLIQLAGGTTFRELPKSTLKKVQIPLLPLDEQRWIVGILNRAAKIERLRKQAAERLREFIPALFIKMFGDPVENPMGWRTEPLGDVILNGPQNGLYRPKSEYGSGTPILRIDGFYEGHVTDPASLQRVRVDRATVDKFALLKNDIVINRVNSRPFLGKSAIIPDIEEPTVFESNMMRIGLDSTRILPEFLISMLQIDSIRDQLCVNAKDAINQSSINHGDVQQLLVVSPPLALQRRYAEIVESSRPASGLGEGATKTAVDLLVSLMSELLGNDLLKGRTLPQTTVPCTKGSRAVFSP